jgi:hypothetical protein
VRIAIEVVGFRALVVDPRPNVFRERKPDNARSIAVRYHVAIAVKQLARHIGIAAGRDTRVRFECVSASGLDVAAGTHVGESVAFFKFECAGGTGADQENRGSHRESCEHQSYCSVAPKT